MKSTTVNFPLCSQVRLILPLGVIRRPSYTFSLALLWRVCLGPTGSPANNDLEMTLQSDPESNLKFTLVSAILSETCQSS